MTRLVVPGREHLAAYVEALERGWSADNIGGTASARRELEEIAQDADAFLASLDDPEAKRGPIVTPDGTTFERLPGYRRWIWAEGFCGSIGFRWTPGTEALPPHVLGHIGYAVVPWRRNEGHATAALALLLPDAKALGLAYVELTTDPDNPASQRVIQANSGRLVERFRKHAVYGGAESLRWRIDL